MKVEIENLNGHFKQLTIEIPAETVAAHSDEHFKKIQKDVELKGFRKGKAPLNMVREMYGDSAKQRIARELVERHFQQAVQSHSFSPVNAPEINVEAFSELSGLKFTAKFENTPPVELKKYLGFKKDKLDATVNADDIKKTLDSIRAQMATYETLPEGTGVEKGQFIELDYEASEAGAPVEAASEKNAFFEIGNGTLTADFEKNVMGMKAGDSKNFTVKFPVATTPEETTPVSGKTLDFSVKVHAVKKRILPDLSDEMAQKIGPFETLAALTTRIEEDMKKEKEQKYRREQLEKIVTWLISENPVDAPETMVSQQMEQLAIEAGMQLQQMGLDEKAIEERLKTWGNEMTERAHRQVKASLLLSNIAKQENIKASDDDIRQEITRISVQSRKSPKEVFEELQERGMLLGLVRQLTELKALDFVLEKAT